MTPARVAFVSFDFGEYCVPIANALAQRTRVLLLLAEQQLARAATPVDARVELVPFRKPRLRDARGQVRMCRQLVTTIERFAPDVVHLQQGHLWFNLALPLLRRRRPLVVTAHNVTHHPGDAPSRRTPQAVLDFGFRRADRVIVHGRSIGDQARARPAFAGKPVHVIPHVSLVEPVPPVDGDAAGAARTVLFFGRIWPYKGLEYLIRAEPLISERVGDLRIVIAGEGEDFGRYRALMVNHDRFRVENQHVSNARRTELFRAADVVALPYVEASQSGVVSVAQAFEKPVVATAVGALPDAVEDGRTGYVVPPRDVAALADAIVSLLRDERLRRELGRNGRRKLERECSPDSVAIRTMGVYAEAMADRATASA
jgi:starch synthase